MSKQLTIGRVAKKAGVNIETIRYYQRIGIIKEPQKPLSGFRIYSTDTINRITFIKRAQQLGFSLKEVVELLDLGEGHCADVRLKAEMKRKQIEDQIRDLKKLHSTLDTLINTCQQETGSVACPIVETLANIKQS